jgi:putative Holliday junction resolvase
LDLGEVRTGVAVSDAGRSLARPVEIVPSGEIEDYLRNLVAEQGVAEVVVGVPTNMRGEVGFQARRVLSKIDDLEDMFSDIRFVRWDERLTTRIASAGRGKSRKKKGERGLDHIAAAGMLQEYLDLEARESL